MVNHSEGRVSIAVAYAVAVLLLVGVGMMAAVRLGHISNALDDLTNELAAEIVLSKQIENQVLLTQLHVNRTVIRGTQSDFDQFRHAFDRLQVLLAQADEEITEPERVALLERVRPAVHAYGEAFREVVALIRTRQRIESEVLDVEGQQIDDKLTALRMHVISLDEPRAYLAVGNARSAFQSMRLHAARYLVTGDERHSVLFEASHQQLTGALSSLDEIVTAPAQRENVSAARSAVASYWEGFQAVHRAVIEMNRLVEDELDELEPEISAAASEMVTSVEADFARENASSQRLINQTRGVLMLTTLIAALTSIVLGVVFWRRLEEREQAQRELQAAHDALEVRVRERTAELEQANQEIEKRRTYLEAVLRAAPDAIISTDSAGRIVEWNQGAEALFGYSSEEAMGELVDQLVTVPDVYGEAVGLSQVVAEGKELPATQTVRYTKDGDPVEVLVAASPIMTGEEFSGLVGIYTDISARVRAEEALQAYAAALETRNEELDTFAHTAAHDLKNPLSHISGYAQVLAEGYGTELDEVSRECVDAILRAVDAMGSIIDELLLFATVRRQDVVREPLDMGKIVEGALKALEPAIERQTAQVVAPSDWPDAVGYAPWVKAVWVNYVSNAIKYGGDPDEGIPPRVVLGYDEGGAQPRFWVRDNGPGLKQAEQERLFAPFTRLEQTRGQGHGLGLSIVRRVVEKLEGEVGVESERGEGATFSFTLPRVEGE